MNDLISVIMPSYNTGKYISDSIKSVIDQTYPDWELIIVDDCSTDDTVDVINSFSDPRIILLKNEINSGAAVSRNRALRAAKGRWIAFLDSDDIWEPEKLEKQISFMEKHPEYDLVGSWVDEFYNDIDHVISIRLVPESHNEIYAYCKSRCPVNHPTVIFRKKAVLDAGGYLTEYFPEDYFLWIRMLMNGAKFFNMQESLLFFRVSPDTIKKRGGWKYAIGEVHIQKMIYDIGFISYPSFVKNSIVRFTVRILPLWLRSLVYRNFLREKKACS